MNKIDLVHKLDSELERYKGELGPEQTVAGADRLRELLRRRAAIYETLEDFARAEASYDALIDVKPIDPTVYSDRGYFYMRQSRFKEAMRDFTTGSALAPTQSSFHYAVGRASSRMGDYAAAIDEYAEAIRLAPRDSAPLVSRAEAYIQLGKYTQARADYDRAVTLGLRREGDRFFVYFGRGYADIRVDDYEAAVRDMNAALSMRPNMIHPVVWRGYALEKMGQFNQALADYESALRSSPNDEWIRASITRVRSYH
jgi:Flp pilus assembly protein TadD